MSIANRSKCEYQPEDVLTYIGNVVEVVSAVASERVSESREESDDTDVLLQLIDKLHATIRREADKFGVHGSTYSNGIPTRYHFKGEPITDPEGNTYRPATVVDVHPSGRIDVAIPEDQQPWWWRNDA